MLYFSAMLSGASFGIAIGGGGVAPSTHSCPSEGGETPYPGEG